MKAKKQRPSRRPPTSRRRRYWSARVTRESDALTLEQKVFRKETAAEIAHSLKRSAERSRRRKATPYRSAMSMLTYYINRAGKNLSGRRLRILERAKTELRKAFGRV
jgi:hydroxyacyl-ACP dehydratase HTD2-like protein with hotdog domain